MTVDRIRVNLVPLTAETARSGIIPVPNVGVSEIEAHLREGFGEDVPTEERARRVSERLLNSMTTLSTDPEYTTLAELDHMAWLSHWLKLTDPVVNDARTAGGYVHRELTDRENNDTAAKRPLSPDFTYVYSVFNLSSFVISAELGLEHPSTLPKLLIERADTPAGYKTPEQIAREEQRKSLELFSVLPQVRAADRRRLKEILRHGENILSDSVAFTPRLTKALKRAGPSNRP